MAVARHPLAHHPQKAGCVMRDERSERQKANDRKWREMAERFEIMMRVGSFTWKLEYLPELRQIDDIVCRLIQRENAKKGER